jgi:predicted TIM-barrel fold metal-dependent hydrolase
MEDHGYDVIDVHHHVDTGTAMGEAVNIGQAARSHDGEDPAASELEHRLALMDAEHVRGAVIIAGGTYLRPNGLADTMAVNDKVAAYCASRPDRFLAGVGIVEPMHGEAGYGEAQRCRDLGLRGVSFHNRFQGVPVDSKLMRNVIEKVGEAGLVPFVHSIGDWSESIWQIDALARDFPDLPMIVLDVFHDYTQVMSLPDVAERRPNLFFDLALSLSFAFMGLPEIRAVGADRFLFGTDMYSWPTMTRPLGNLLAEILISDLTHEEKTAIFSGNVKRILDL